MPPLLGTPLSKNRGDTSGLALLPVVKRHAVTIFDDKKDALKVLAINLLKEHPALARQDLFGPGVRCGVSTALWLVLGDTREISLMGQGGEATYEYRASLLARPGDMAAFGGTQHAAFERYRAEVLGKGPLVCLNPQAIPGMPSAPLAERVRRDPHVVSAVVQSARAAGGLTLLPHIGMGSAWGLAGTLAAETGLTIDVACPRPQLTRLVNDKTWFAQVTRKVLGEHALPPSFSTFGPAALASRARTLARSAERIVVKIPDSAGGAGNFCFSGSALAGLPLSEVRQRILCVLQASGWRETFPLLVGLWEAPVLSSPSVQIWIPAIEDGEPIVEGVFEQLLEGSEGAFVGSVPASLPGDWHDRLAAEAFCLAFLFQLLGYFGRCSFDALLVGRSTDDAELHWIECNGRWGGVSVPMTIVNQIAGTGEPPAFVVVQDQSSNNHPLGFEQAWALLDDLLLKPNQRDDGIVLLSPVEIESGSGVQLLACSTSRAGAAAIARGAVERLRGQ